MAYDNKQLVKLAALEELANRLTQGYATKGEVAAAAAAAGSAFKSLKVDGNTVNFYTSTDKTGDPAATLDFPVEYFLDQSKTALVEKFAWSEDTYPGSTDPNLNNKPVLVLAVKGDDDSVSYSFLNMQKLMNVYTAKGEGKDGSTTVTFDGYELEVTVNISEAEDNILTTDADGKLYVKKPAAVDISGKADKVEDATAGHFAGLDANGNLTDSGKSATDFSKVTASENAGYISVDGTDVKVVGIATDAEVKEMLDGIFGTDTQD